MQHRPDAPARLPAADRLAAVRSLDLSTAQATAPPAILGIGTTLGQVSLHDYASPGDFKRPVLPLTERRLAPATTER